jgi:hypothetical protein
MLRNTKDFNDLAIRASDGEIGHVKDLYFDDDAWVVRYLIVETGSWLSSRKVLVSPIAAQQPDWHGKTLPVALTRDQVGDSPNIDTDKPVSRQHEEQYLGYYGYPNYWDGMGLWGEGVYPLGAAASDMGNRPGWAERQHEDEVVLRMERERHRNDDPHLRSCEAVIGYRVQGMDGETGNVSGFLVDEVTWAIRYLIVDTSNWWVGHKVLIAVPWITGVHWSSNTVSIDLNRSEIKASPAYDSDALLDRKWEIAIHQHYRRTGYWALPEAVEA